jgi:hypothetical protein
MQNSCCDHRNFDSEKHANIPCSFDSMVQHHIHCLDEAYMLCSYNSGPPCVHIPDIDEHKK